MCYKGLASYYKLKSFVALRSILVCDVKKILCYLRRILSICDTKRFKSVLPTVVRCYMVALQRMAAGVPLGGVMVAALPPGAAAGPAGRGGAWW